MQFVSFLLKKNRLSRSSLAPRLFLLKGRRAVPVFKPGRLPLRLFSLDRLVTLNPSLLQQVIGLLPHPLLSSICYYPLLWKYFSFSSKNLFSVLSTYWALLLLAPIKSSESFFSLFLIALPRTFSSIFYALPVCFVAEVFVLWMPCLPVCFCSSGVLDFD